MNRDAYLALEALQQRRYVLAQILEQERWVSKRPWQKEREGKHSLRLPRNSFEFSDNHRQTKPSWCPPLPVSFTRTT